MSTHPFMFNVPKWIVPVHLPVLYFRPSTPPTPLLLHPNRTTNYMSILYPLRATHERSKHNVMLCMNNCWEFYLSFSFTNTSQYKRKHLAYTNRVALYCRHNIINCFMITVIMSWAKAFWISRFTYVTHSKPKTCSTMWQFEWIYSHS